MKLTYWIAQIKTDSTVYSIRAKTRRECKRLLAERGASNDYCKPHKVGVLCASAFDLIEDALGEGGPHWEEDCES